MPQRCSPRPRRTALTLFAGALAVAAATAGVTPALADPAPPSGELGGAAASALVPAVEAAAGPALAGVWFAPDAGSPTAGNGRLMVGTWDAALAPALSALGATPVLRSGPRRDPAAALRTLQQRTASAMPASLAEYGVDPTTQQLVVTTVGDGPDTALTALLAGIDPATIRLEHVAALPQHQAAISGGDTITDSDKRCTAGFAARGGSTDWLITAGHCTQGSTSWRSGTDGATIGSEARTAGGNVDVGAIPLNPSTTASPTVGGVPVTGTRTAPVGSSVCLYGSTSGRTCGSVARTGVTVNFDGEQQSGLTAVNVCAKEGDSGGPYITSDGQAQGVHTGAGGNGDCTSYFTPIATTLSALDLTLKTG